MNRQVRFTEYGLPAVLTGCAKVIPSDLRSTAFALATDLKARKFLTDTSPFQRAALFVSSRAGMKVASPYTGWLSSRSGVLSAQSISRISRGGRSTMQLLSLAGTARDSPCCTFTA